MAETVVLTSIPVVAPAVPVDITTVYTAAGPLLLPQPRPTARHPAPVLMQTVPMAAAMALPLLPAYIPTPAATVLRHIVPHPVRYTARRTTSAATAITTMGTTCPLRLPATW